MLLPSEVNRQAKRKEDENINFRIYLKIHADEEELDTRFLKLHEELFAGYDCSQCRNCCKMYKGSIPGEDLVQDAKHLHLSIEEFKNKYLFYDEMEETYYTQHKPCDFLEEDGSCKLGKYRPKSCKDYPYTNQPGRCRSLFAMLSHIEVCPVAFEIYERLKKLYHYKSR